MRFCISNHVTVKLPPNLSLPFPLLPHTFQLHCNFTKRTDSKQTYKVLQSVAVVIANA